MLSGLYENRTAQQEIPTLRPQARFGAQPPERAALGAEMSLRSLGMTRVL